jgi:hypothetical protein
MRLPGIKVVLLLGVTVGAHAGEGRPEVPPDLILERFSVAKGGDPLTVPVKVGGKDHIFVVDTGSDVTLFDTSLPLGEPLGVFRLKGSRARPIRSGTGRRRPRLAGFCFVLSTTSPAST